ncbi:MAG: (Fe-S)-binding protein [Desulforudis sp.]|nr:4Fe-4S binding protein [Clostridia bacterium]MDQ7792550.1 4Fe-4S binding protein [Clostridia bacterium]RJX20910.1 MAG: (Fe-S)-binding protein [Desulforudis sp.]
MAKVLTVTHMNRCIACYSCMLACSRVVYGHFSAAKSAIQIRTRGGLQSKLAANICIGCFGPPCAEACPEDALVARKGGGVRFHSDKCTGCRACVAACIADVIAFDEEDAKPIVCVQCGSCARFCPHGVLEMAKKPVEAQ